MTESDRVTVAVLGGGPAGLALARACVRRGLSTSVLAPDLDLPWGQNFGAFEDEAAALGLHEHLECAAEAFTFVDDAPLPLRRRYGRLDGAALKQALLDEVGHDRCIRVAVLAVDADATGFALRCSDGRTLSARFVVDATGKGRFLTRPERRQTPARQVALGVDLPREAVGSFPTDRAILMDFRAVDDTPISTFLYALPRADGGVFVEETVLATRAPVDFAFLEQRLRRRLMAHNIDWTKVRATEHCDFPIDEPLPDLPQPVVGFGAAAAFVHPATGYQVLYAFRQADRLASIFAGAGPDETTAAVSARAWHTLWPRAARVSRWLHLTGLELVLRLSPDETRAFFARFFELSPARWSAYMARTGGPRATLDAMWGVFWAHRGRRWALFRRAMPLLGTSLRSP